MPRADDFYFNVADGTGDYFQVDIAANDIDYKSLYAAVYSYSQSAVGVCDTTRRQDSRTVWRTLAEDLGSSCPAEWSANLYAPLYADDVKRTVEGNTVTYVLGANAGEPNICAPSQGTIETSHYACNYGSDMLYVISLSDGSVYSMRVTGAKCWYCCADKPVPEDGRYTATTKDSLKGQSMRVGDVLAVGQPGTVVTIMLTT